MKRNIRHLLVFIILLFVATIILTGCALGDSLLIFTDEQPTVYEVASSSETPIVAYGNATNIVILICFNDEDPTSVRNNLPAGFVDRFNGNDYSLKDYYHDLSFGKFTVNSVFPTYNNGSFYIYKDSRNRSYYTSNSSSSGSKRTGPESTLLNNAVYEASVYLNLSSNTIDVNNDGYVDCVTFLISGNYSESNWNKLMWPHSWQLDTITKEYDSSSSAASISGKKVNDYTFLFIDSFADRMGLACHEMGHTVGNLPDLYHYTSSYSKYLPVGYWDLMHLDCNTPQFMTTYLRWKYLSFADDNQIIEMERSGNYTLKPTTVATSSDTLAYKITIDNGTATPNESIWIEYRRNDVSTYDRDLPGSGLIVYRINTNATEGNKNARNQTNRLYTSYPDELYVFRPDASTNSNLGEKEKENLSYAYVSAENSRFPSLGNADITSTYHQSCIYLTNGSNTGIVITPVSESAEGMTFHIELGKYDSSEIDYENTYITQNDSQNRGVVEINYGDDIKSNISLYIKRKNRGVYRADDDAITLLGGDSLYEVCEEGKTAYIEYTDQFGTYRFPYLLIVHDKLESTSAEILSLPTKTSYMTGDTFSLAGLAIRVIYASGLKTISYTEQTQQHWSAIGYNMNISGQQTVTVTYNDDVQIAFSIIVRSNILRIFVDEKNTMHLMSSTTTPDFRIFAEYEDGTTSLLDADKYILDYPAVEEQYLNQKNYVTIRLKEQTNLTCCSYFFKVNQRASSIVLAADPKRSYKYGEALDLVEGKLQITFGEYTLDGDNVLPMENFYDAITGYNPKVTGNQTVRLTFEDATLPFEVTVLPLPDRLLYTATDKIDIRESLSTILLQDDFTLERFSENVSCYLNVSYLLTVDLKTFSIEPSTYGSKLMNSKVQVVLTNSEGKEIRKYSVLRSGDGNDDGVLDDKDVSYWKQSILAKEEIAKGLKFDQNGDNRYTLTDYVILIDKIGGTK